MKIPKRLIDLLDQNKVRYEVLQHPEAVTAQRIAQVDKRLAEQNYIVFEAGTHSDAIKMNYSDYEEIVQPRVADLAVKIQPMKGA
ncbi:MAG: hypothetical protein DME51_13715 [Verrucomicrobia bacterium]|nr:MAG: hypothetical protein DME51_13715 [Verrucomicrobiota bacterium]